MVWERRAATRDGLALYALQGVCTCPIYVMATLAELAEHGIEAQPKGVPLPPRDAVCSRPDCGHAGGEHQHAGTGCWANGERERRADGTLGPVKLCGCEAFMPAEDVTPQVTKLRALLAERRAAVEDPHDSPLHHRYVVSHDLPPVGGQ
jgi:hypothetical protein